MGLPLLGQHKGGTAELPENDIVRNGPYVLTPGPFEGRITTDRRCSQCFVIDTPAETQWPSAVLLASFSDALTT